jgi:hypothetical protein
VLQTRETCWQVLGYDLPKDALDPSDDLVTGGVGRLVKVDDTGRDVRLEVTLQGRAAVGDRGEVTSADEN